MFACLGLDPDGEHQDTRVALTRHLALWDHVMRGVDDPALPIDVGATRSSADLQVRGFAVATSSSGWEAVERAIRFAGLTTDTTTVALRELRPGLVRLDFLRDGPRTLGHRCANECALASWVAQLRAVLSPQFMPTRVHFRHAPPSDLQAHRRHFGGALDFDSPYDAVEFESAVLDNTPRTANPAMREFFDQLAQRMLAELDRAVPEIVLQVKQLVAARLASGSPKMTDIAAQMELSERALRRRLSAEGFAYADVVSQVRTEIGKHLLKEPNRSLSQIAFALGFSEHSAFTRFFRAQTGTTPQQHRQARTESGTVVISSAK